MNAGDLAGDAAERDDPADPIQDHALVAGLARVRKLRGDLVSAERTRIEALRARPWHDKSRDDDLGPVRMARLMERPLRYHFSGLAGAGVNPLAQLMRARGHAVQGSDRSFDQGKGAALAARLAGLGIVV